MLLDVGAASGESHEEALVELVSLPVRDTHSTADLLSINTPSPLVIINTICS
jgi:hypothetical protein